MSPVNPLIFPMYACFPRTRGDEPTWVMRNLMVGRFSPHARG